MRRIEGDRACRRRVKTVRWTVLRESIAETLNYAHAASNVAVRFFSAPQFLISTIKDMQKDISLNKPDFIVFHVSGA